MNFAVPSHHACCAKTTGTVYVSKNDEICINTEEFCIKNEEFCIKTMNLAGILWRGRDL